MDPHGGEFSFGSGFAAAARDRLRGDFETRFLRDTREIGNLAFKVSPSKFFHDVLAKIQLAPSLDGFDSYIKGAEALSAAHNDGKVTPFSWAERSAIKGELFAKILEGFDTYVSIDMDASVDKAVRLCRSAMKVTQYFKDDEGLKKPIGQTIDERISKAVSYNPTLSYAAKEVLMLTRVAEAIGYKIPVKVRKDATFLLTEGLLKDFQRAPYIGDIKFRAKEVMTAVKALDVPQNKAHLAEVAEALVSCVESTIAHPNPYRYEFLAETVKNILGTIGVDYTTDIKDRLHGSMVKKGLKVLESSPHDKSEMGKDLVEGLRAIGTSEETISLLQIHIAGAEARGALHRDMAAQRDGISAWEIEMRAKIDERVRQAAPNLAL